MRQRYKQRGAPKDRCRGQGMGSVFRFAPKKKKKKKPDGQKSHKMALQKLPGIYEKGVKRIKNKKLKKKKRF